ncbi:hypothetical protein PAHAL_1G321800 [Panicum hallii]|uniref:Uncharacterized protein n=1 Tax=Panicum hallii TaxID=206008 RepID=A0A2S3GRD0_9POAL|nr:hypothetical protein PAHAL_1G321800 [Panicum hallii]
MKAEGLMQNLKNHGAMGTVAGDGASRRRRRWSVLSSSILDLLDVLHELVAVAIYQP